MVYVLDIWNGSISDADYEQIPFLLYTMNHIHEEGYKNGADLFHIRIREGEECMNQQERPRVDDFASCPRRSMTWN